MEYTKKKTARKLGCFGKIDKRRWNGRSYWFIVLLFCKTFFDCDYIFYLCHNTEVETLQVLQNIVIRTTLNCEKRTPLNQMLDQLKS